MTTTTILQRHLELDLKIAEALTAWIRSKGIPGTEQMIRERSAAKATKAHLELLKSLVIIINWVNSSGLDRDDLRMRLLAIECQYREEAELEGSSGVDNLEVLSVLRHIINVLPRASDSAETTD